MSADVAVSLFWIVAVSVLAPLVAGSVPRRLVPDVVVLLVAGIVIGPYALDLAQAGPEIDMLKELGLGMLFLLAGYELDPAELKGRGGRRALVTWLCCLATAFGVVFLLSRIAEVHAEVAVAIALTSTALGTLLPILQDRGLVNTRLGRTVLNHGAFGELGPVIAMAVLLGAHGAGAEVLVLLLFVVLAAVVAAVPRRILREGSHALTVVRLGADSNSQTTVRLTLLLLVSLIALAAVFDLDIILGAFAAGFILRRFMPAGDEKLETKLNGLAYGLLIPVFFVVSGMNIDIAGVVSRPGVLVVFIALMLLCRGLPVLIATRWERDGGYGVFDIRERTQVALYSATGLPLIVAVTTVAVQAGDMSTGNASVLVAAGAITVLVFPAAALLLGRGEVEEPLPAPHP
ncbi:MAG TPA: cation:proton antiporter [Aldersonia sp.]